MRLFHARTLARLTLARRRRFTAIGLGLVVRRDPREAWAEDAQRLAQDCGDALVWPELANEAGDSLVW